MNDLMCMGCSWKRTRRVFPRILHIYADIIEAFDLDPGNLDRKSPSGILTMPTGALLSALAGEIARSPGAILSIRENSLPRLRVSWFISDISLCISASGPLL